MKTTYKLLGLGLFCVIATCGLSAHAEDKTAESEKAGPEEYREDTVKTKAKAKSKGKKKEEGVWKVKLEEVRATAGVFTEDPAPSTGMGIFGAASAKMQSGMWEFALGARVDAQSQGGNPDFFRAKLDYTENYVRWRGEEMRLTVGTQNVLWGRVDEISPIDRLSRADLTRLVLDKQPERRRAVPAVRMEQFWGDYKLDAVWLPLLDSAVMPHVDSAWHPVDTVNGRLLGIGNVPAAIGAAVQDDTHGNGGAGVRLTRTGGSMDYGLSVQRTRQSMPYYQLGAGVLTGVHPYAWVVGTELETQKAGATWRMELAWTSDVPVTNLLGQMETKPGWDAVVGAEFFPGDAETRVTLQLAGHSTQVSTPILDRKHIYAMTGEVEHPFAQGRWRFNVRFVAGLNDRDVYLNPKFTFLGIDQHEIYLAGHLFSGEAKTLGGFYKDKDFVELGWRAKF